MKKYLMAIGLVLLAGFWSNAFADPNPTNEPRDLVLIAGQSNAVGFDADPAGLPVDAADAVVMFWWRCGDPPPDAHDVTSHGWTTLQPQPKGDPMSPKAGKPRQYGNFSHAAGGFGPEMGFARALYAQEKKPLAIVKVAFSGTGMTTDWNHRDAGASGACYRALVSETKSAITEATKRGIPLRLRAFVWVQGESDASAKCAPEYEKNLGEMIRTLRADLNAPELMALIGVNTNFGNGKNKFMPEIVRQQQALAAHLTRCVYVDTGGLTYANAAHFDTKSTIEVGQRFAAALVRAEQAASNNPSSAKSVQKR
jgi:hypothetical protein